jgi:WD40 repeat protein
MSLNVLQHTDTVTCVKWASDGKRYVTASTDGSIKIWWAEALMRHFCASFDAGNASEKMYVQNDQVLLRTAQYLDILNIV